MKIAVITLAAVVLAGCEQLSDRLRVPDTARGEPAYSPEMECVDVAVSGLRVGMSRCQNHEVDCYVVNGKGISCRWKP